MKKLILFLLLLSPNLVWSETIKLSCTIKTIEDYSNGFTETKQYKEIFEVTQTGSFISIIPTSENFNSVTNLKNKNTVSINDFSDSNKWDITNNNKYESGKTDNTSIQIDRNIGRIWYSRTFDNLTLVFKVSGTGDCEKVNITKKKF